MFLRNLIMAIVLALFYLKVFKNIALTVRKLEKENELMAQTYPIVYISLLIFYGLVLNVLLTVAHVTEFKFGDIFLCITAVAFYEEMIGEKL